VLNQRQLNLQIMQEQHQLKQQGEQQRLQEEQQVYQQLNEELRERDLHNLVDNIFEIDSYASKMGSDKDVVVLSFTVEEEMPAKDLVNFVERGYNFILDADATPGELKDGKYKVFVEIERNRRIGEQIMELLDGVEKLTGIEQFKFRYHKGFNSVPVDADTITEVVPGTADEYEMKIKESRMNNFSNFFNKSYLESISISDEDINFQRKYSEPLRMKIKDFGTKEQVYEKIQGPLMFESRDVAEVLYITKYLGNYNVTKIGSTFVLENEGYALALEKL
jgi:hypothetical protein